MFFIPRKWKVYCQWPVTRAFTKRIHKRGDVKAFIDLDARFHEIIARYSGSQRLLELAQTLRRHMLRYRIQSIYSVDNVLRAIDGHRGMLRAIEKRDLEEVNRAIRNHMEQVKKDVLKYAFKGTAIEKR